MGQRSQIYVRYNKKQLVIASYYGWNYGERMISRARYGIEYIKRNKYIDWEKISRVFDVNFDMKDVAISKNIIEEYKEYFQEEDFNDFVFRMQDNNDGKLFVDISEDGTIKYAFLDCECNTDYIMNATQYMDWNSEEWEKSEYIEDVQKTFLRNNLKKIEEMAILMTKDELEDFINYDYKV